MYVLPDDRKKTKRKTKILKCTLEPQWKESFQWSLPLDTPLTVTSPRRSSTHVQNRLVISVFDWDRMTQNDFMVRCHSKQHFTRQGKMAFSLSELSKASVSGWYLLLDNTQGALHNFRSREQDPAAMTSAPASSRRPSEIQSGDAAKAISEADFQFLKVARCPARS